MIMNHLFLQTQLEKTQTEVQQMIQDRLRRIRMIKHSVELRKVGEIPYSIRLDISNLIV